MNIVTWLNDYVQREVSLNDKAKSRLTDSNHYFQVLSRKEAKFIKQTDFSVVLQYDFPESLLKFDKTQIREIDSYVKNFEGYQTFCVHLQLLAKILADFEKAEDLDNPISVSIFKTYEVLKLYLKSRFPEIYAEYQRRIAVFKEKSTIEKPKCPRCGSSEVISYGVRWMCKSCKRTWLKKKTQ